MCSEQLSLWPPRVLRRSEKFRLFIEARVRFTIKGRMEGKQKKEKPERAEHRESQKETAMY